MILGVAIRRSRVIKSLTIIRGNQEIQSKIDGLGNRGLTILYKVREVSNRMIKNKIYLAVVVKRKYICAKTLVCHEGAITCTLELKHQK